MEKIDLYDEKINLLKKKKREFVDWDEISRLFD